MTAREMARDGNNRGRSARRGARVPSMPRAPRDPDSGLLARLSGRAARRNLHAPDYWLITIVLTLVMFGTVMVFSSSFAIGIEDSGNAYYYLIRQVIWLCIGLVGMLITYKIDYHFWRRFSLPGMVVILLLLGVVIVMPGSAGEAFGAKRWIPLGPLSFQPSEVAKPILIIYLANWLGQKGPKIRRFDYGLLPFGLFLGVMIGLIMLQPDLGTSILLAAIGISMFLVAGADLLQLSLLMGIGFVAFLVLALGASYRRARILIFLNPATDLRNLGWQLEQARLALGSGGLFGLGLGASRQKFSWLPAAQNDAIFAVIGEELGLVGCAFVLSMFLALAWRGYRVAKRAPDTFGTLVAVGIVTWMIFQAAINIGGITTTIPFTGIPLPFISYGGTALAVSLTAIGILLNISRQTVSPSEIPQTPPLAEERRTVRAASGRGRRVEPASLESARRAPAWDAPREDEYASSADEFGRTPRLIADGGTGGTRGTRAERIGHGRMPGQAGQPGQVRSVDGRQETRSGSFGRGRPRRAPRGPSRQHWR